jgi:hypothetical protein
MEPPSDGGGAHVRGDLWQARATRRWRCYFTIEGDTYRLHDIIAHPK